MTNKEIIKECRRLALAQNLAFRRSLTVNKINGAPCYEIESVLQYKILHQGCLLTIWDTLLNGSLEGK